MNHAMAVRCLPDHDDGTVELRMGYGAEWQSNERGTGRKTLVFTFPVVVRG